MSKTIYCYYVSSNYPDKGYKATVRKDINGRDGELHRIGGKFNSKEDAKDACLLHYQKAVKACSNFGKPIPTMFMM